MPILQILTPHPVLLCSPLPHMQLLSHLWAIVPAAPLCPKPSLFAWVTPGSPSRMNENHFLKKTLPDSPGYPRPKHPPLPPTRAGRSPGSMHRAHMYRCTMPRTVSTFHVTHVRRLVPGSEHALDEQINPAHPLDCSIIRVDGVPGRAFSEYLVSVGLVLGSPTRPPPILRCLLNLLSDHIFLDWCRRPLRVSNSLLWRPGRGTIQQRKLALGGEWSPH